MFIQHLFSSNLFPKTEEEKKPKTQLQKRPLAQPEPSADQSAKGDAKKMKGGEPDGKVEGMLPIPEGGWLGGFVTPNWKAIPKV